MYAVKHFKILLYFYYKCNSSVSAVQSVSEGRLILIFVLLPMRIESSSCVCWITESYGPEGNSEMKVNLI